MAKKSAGILLYRLAPLPEVLLVHPGGPFFSKKDIGAWSIPKGEIAEDEDPLAAAKREFEEETGFAVNGKFHALSPIKQAGGKMVHCWALEGTIDVAKIKSNTFEVEWPPKSGVKKSFPEIDKAQWFTIEEAMQKINPKQGAFVEELVMMFR